MLLAMVLANAAKPGNGGWFLMLVLGAYAVYRLMTPDAEDWDGLPIDLESDATRLADEHEALGAAERKAEGVTTS